VRLAAVLVLLVACGDSVAIEQQLEATSGTRIKLEKFIYEDGTTQVDTSAYYDTGLHTRCAPQKWIDGEMRCVPLTDEAVFTDDACTAAIGIVRMTPEERDPTAFIGYDVVENERVPARLYRAGVVTDFVAQYYERRGTECLGPFTSPENAVFVTITAELASTSMPIIVDSEVGAGRLGLRVQTTVDGLFAPVGLRDRTFESECTPTLRADGVACQPDLPGIDIAYANPACTEPVLVTTAETPPLITRTFDTEDGCASYRVVGAEVTAVWSRSNGGSCVSTTLPPDLYAYRIDEPAEPPWLERTIVPGSRRLAPVTLEDQSDSALRFTGERLVDHATRAECVRVLVGKTMRCMPASTIASREVYGPSCATSVRIVELPEHSCVPITFATSVVPEEGTINLHAIGDLMTAPMFQLTEFGCQPYVNRPGTIARQLGPALPPETFPAALRYGER